MHLHTINGNILKGEKRDTFLFLVLSTWKGRILLLTGSQATASQSNTKDFNGILQFSMLLDKLEMISGYFWDMSSRFRENKEHFMGELSSFE